MATWLAIAACLVGMVAAVTAASPMDPHAVLQFGGKNNKNFYSLSRIRPCNVGKLVSYCNITVDGEVSDGASIVNGLLHVSTWSGTTLVVDVSTPACRVIASTFLPNQTGRSGVMTAYGSTGTGSRNVPALALARNIQVIGDLSRAVIYGQDMTTQRIVWQTTLSNATATRITGSQTISGDGQYVYAAVSSLEEGNPACFKQTPALCPFRGLVYKLRVADGAVVWRQQMAPGAETETMGYAGAAVWGGALLEWNNRLYVATGNTYRLPDNVTACLAATNGSVSTCVDPMHMPDAIVCLDATTGAVLWSHSFNLDVWTVACGPDHAPPGMFPMPTCDMDNQEDDADFGQGPMLLRATSPGRPYDVLMVGQKNGYVWTLNPYTGAVLRGVFVSPGSTVGGPLLGHAADNDRAYFGGANGRNVPFTMVNGMNCSSGALTAVDIRTGAIVWQLCDPHANRMYGFLAVTRGLVWAGSMAGDTDNLYAINAHTGAIVATFYGKGSRIQAPVFYKNLMIAANGYTVPGYALGDNTIQVYALADADCDCDDDDNDAND